MEIQCGFNKILIHHLCLDENSFSIVCGFKKCLRGFQKVWNSIQVFEILEFNESNMFSLLQILNCSVTWTELDANASLSLQIWMGGVNKLYTQYEEIRDNDSTLVVGCLLIFLCLKWLLNIYL